MESYVKYNQNVTVNFVKVESKIYSGLDAAKQAKSKISNATVLYNDFLDSLNALYYPPSTSTAYAANRCYIYRKAHSQTYYDYVCMLDEAIALNDYNVHNNDDYEYMAVVAMEETSGTLFYRISENLDDDNKPEWIHTRWSDWSICNIEPSAQDDTVYYKTGNVWLLGLNLNDESLTQNIGVTAWDTLGKYPKISFGEKNYEGSTVTCLLGSMKEVVDDKISIAKQKYDSTEETIVCSTEDRLETRYRYTERLNISDKYGREVEKLNAWRIFCSDGELKLLRDLKGNSWIVQIVESPTHSINQGAFSLPTTISFTWKEVMDVNSISVITEGE